MPSGKGDASVQRQGEWAPSCPGETVVGELKEGE